MRINEIFYSIQGEGANSGTPAIFVRFSGCNLNCNFCDTDFKRYFDVSEEDIARSMDYELYNGCKFVVFTGGEPLLQLNRKLCDLLHEKGFTIAVESNGTIETDLPIDWLTISPKHAFTNAKTKIKRCNEVKLLVDDNTTLEQLDATTEQIKAEKYYLQPIDDSSSKLNTMANTNKAIWLIKDRPQWKISLQLHKILKVR